MTKEKYIDVKKNIEKELKKIIKDNRSHNGLERSEWQAVYSENISCGQLNRPLRTYYITTKAPSGNYVGGRWSFYFSRQKYSNFAILV